MSLRRGQWSILLALVVGSFSVAWALAAGSPASPFNSPVPTFTPVWEQDDIMPTPWPQPIILTDATAGPATLTTGLRGYWRLDETDTANRADSSPVGSNTLTNVGGVSWTAGGQVGNASSFDNSSGTTQYLKIDSNQAVGLNFSYSFSLAGWVKRETTGSEMMLASKYAYGTGINDRAYRLGLTPDDRLRMIVSSDGLYNADYEIVGGSTLTSTTTWYHVAAVFDADMGRLKLYLNGNLDADKAVTCNTIFQSSAPFMLGADQGNGIAIHGFDGLMDEWRAYTRTLSQTEIQALMQ
jgi:hypothetical protein